MISSGTQSPTAPLYPDASISAAVSPFRWRQRSQTLVFSVSFSGAKPPLRSPFSVPYPQMASDLFTVVSSMKPSWLLIDIRMLPRARAWMFSSATPVSSGSEPGLGSFMSNVMPA